MKLIAVVTVLCLYNFGFNTIYKVFVAGGNLIPLVNVLIVLTPFSKNNVCTHKMSRVETHFVYIYIYNVPPETSQIHL